LPVSIVSLTAKCASLSRPCGEESPPSATAGPAGKSNSPGAVSFALPRRICISYICKLLLIEERLFGLLYGYVTSLSPMNIARKTNLS
jgi:hypothetical protein